jgi:hypothetical protein
MDLRFFDKLRLPALLRRKKLIPQPRKVRVRDLTGTPPVLI